MITTDLDLHGLTVDEAIRLIQRTIVENPKLDEINAIHGFNGGRRIKDTLANFHNIHNKRVLYTTDGWNDGITIIVLRRA